MFHQAGSPSPADEAVALATDEATTVVAAESVADKEGDATAKAGKTGDTAGRNGKAARRQWRRERNSR